MGKPNNITYDDTVLYGGHGWELALPRAVAAGALYIKNQNGEFEQVTMASYWRNHENGYFGICNIGAGGEESDEDGQITRRFNKEST
jgi:hypothetical protein